MKNKNLIFKLLISFVMVFTVAFSFGLKTEMHTAEAAGKTLKATVVGVTNQFSLDADDYINNDRTIAYLITSVNNSISDANSNADVVVNNVVYSANSDVVVNTLMTGDETVVYIYPNHSFVRHIDFTPTAVYTGNYTQSAANDTLLLSGTETNTQVTLQYKVVANTGVNNLVLVPTYDKTVFSIASVSVNEAALGEATVTGTEVNADTIKVALESDTTYSGTDTNTVLLTVVFNVNAAVATDGNYTFSLALPEANEALSNYNKTSKANVFLAGEQLGEQTAVEVRVVLNSTNPENVVKILKYKEAAITIGQHYGFEVAQPTRYEFTFNGQPIVTGKVNELTTVSNASYVEYTYNGTATPVVTWYIANFDYYGDGYTYTPGSALDEPPIAAGTYMVGISAAQDGVYLPVAETYRVVKIVSSTINVTIDDKSSVYLCPLASLTANYTAEELATFGYTLTTNATSTSPAGGYTITLSGEGNPNYSVNWTAATYTITKLGITVTAEAQQSIYGEEIVVNQSKYALAYTSQTGNPDIALSAYSFGVTLTKANGINVGTYNIVPEVTSCASAYNLASFAITPVNGVYTITSASGLNLDFFSADEVVYNGQSHNLLIVGDLPNYILSYASTDKDQTNAGTYTIHVTVTIDEQTATNYNCGTQLPVTVENAKITPASVTVSAFNRGHIYGSNPQSLDYSVTGTVYGNDFLNISLTPSVTLSNSTPVGTYPIVVAASNSNYTITLVNGTYTVTKANITDKNDDNIPDNTDENEQTHEDGVKISVSAENVDYNRNLSYSAKVMVGNVVLPADAYTISVELVQATGTTELAGVRKAGQYRVVVTLDGTDNYYGATKSATFNINKINLATPTVTYSAYNTATWTAVGTDSGEVALVEGTNVSYSLGTNRSFTPTAAGSYTIVVGSNNDNYNPVEVALNTVHQITFTDDPNSHPKNNSTPTNMPTDPIITFIGDDVPNYPMPNEDPELLGYDFDEWVKDGDTYKTSWTIKKYTVTLKFTETSSTLNTDMFTVEAEYKGTIAFTLASAPTKAGTAGISYTYNNKVVYNTTEYTAAYENGKLTVTGYELTGTGVVFVAQYNETINSFNIKYYVKSTPTAETYTLWATDTSVAYNSTITYRSFTTEVHWFKTTPWFADEARTQAAPSTMPAAELNVYAAIVFDVGQGDVNGDRSVDANDITLYRQWIVGGYEMTVVALGSEWTNAQSYNEETRYFLNKVADNNNDSSRDIRDVSVTRMAIVGGYSWSIETGVKVTGDDIVRDTRAATTSELKTALLASSKNVCVVADITAADEDFTISPSKDMNLDLYGHTLTVKSFVVSTNDDDVTLTIVNGTIVTTDGITISAPNGNVVLTDLVGYVNNNPVNLAAASNSLHINGLVEFRNGTTETSTYAPVNVAGGTHLVVEENSNIVAQKLVVPNNGTISIKNDSVEATAIVVEGTYTVDTASVVENFVYTTENLTDIATKEQLASASGDCRLVADIDCGNSDIVYSANVTLNLNGHNITFSKWGFEVREGATLTFNGKGNVSSTEATLYAQYAGHLVVNGGTYIATNNFVIGTSGNTGRGGNTVVINGGTFNASMTAEGQEKGYVACGIYVANSDTVVVNGGTFNVANGVGILARSGNTTVKSDVVFNVTGNGSLGRVGDSQVTIPTGEVLVVDYAAAYPGGVPSLTNETSNSLYYVLNTNITTEADLIAFRNAVNAGNNFADKTFELNADITLTGAWLPISNYSRKDDASQSKWFAGTFDGNGHTISGLTNAGLTDKNITVYSDYTYGLFGSVKNAVIKDLTLTNVNISANDGDSLGALVGYYVGNETKTNISNISISGTVAGSDNVGGVVGRASGTYFKALNVTVSGTVSAKYKASGLVGTGNAAEMVFENCTNNANVSSTVLDSTNAGYNAVAGLSITWKDVCKKVVMKGCSNKGTITTVNPNAIHGELAVDYSPQTQLDANGTWTYGSSWTYSYTIGTLAELETFRNEVNAGNDFAGKKVTLAADITLTSGWTPIGEGSRKLGNVALVGYPTYFRGEFDGNNHTISGLTNAGFTPSEGRIVSGQYAYGLFALVGDGAYFHDLTLANVAIDTTTYQGAIGDSVGALVGYSIGNIRVDNITVSGTVKASESVGGIIGRSICDSASVAGSQTVRVTNCTNYATVIGYGSDDNAVKASGIVGYTAIYANTTGSIVLTNNTNNGSVSATNTYTGNNTYKVIVSGIACYGQGTANSENGSVTITGNTNNASVSGSAAVVWTDPIARLSWLAFKSGNTTIENNTNNYLYN